MRAEDWFDARQAGRQVTLKLRNGNIHMRGFYIAVKAAIISIAVFAPFHVNAQNIVQLGYGRLVNNDFLGDFKDRGQTGSYVSSRIYGKAWGEALPTRAGEILEFRVQADIKAPENLVNAAAGDRPFAGSVSLGLHTHYEQRGIEIAMGSELVAVGPNTRLDQFQTALHDALGVAPPSQSTRDAQVGNKIYPGVVVEFGKPFALGSRSQVRPFVEARAGVETLVRAGVDFEIGRMTRGDLMVRDGITGQRYRTMGLGSGSGGVSFVVGFDTAVVSESAYLPSSQGLVLTDRRDRVRAGMHWQRKKGHGFVGITYLGREFKS